MIVEGNFYPDEIPKETANLGQLAIAKLVRIIYVIPNSYTSFGKVQNTPGAIHFRSFASVVDIHNQCDSGYGILAN